MKSPYFSDYFCEKIIVIDEILAFPWLLKVRSLEFHYRVFVGAGYECCCDVIEGGHLPRTYEYMTEKRERGNHFKRAGY